jgi:hypothetical protein
LLCPTVLIPNLLFLFLLECLSVHMCTLCDHYLVFIHLVSFPMFSLSSHFVSFAPCSLVCVSYQDSITVHCTQSYYTYISASRLSLTPFWWYASFYIWWFGKLLQLIAIALSVYFNFLVVLSIHNNNRNCLLPHHRPYLHQPPRTICKQPAIIISHQFFEVGC